MRARGLERESRWVGQEAGGSKGGRWWCCEEPEVGGGLGGMGGRVGWMRRPAWRVVQGR